MMPCIIAGKGEAAIIWAICRMRSGSAAIAAICSCHRSIRRFAKSWTEGSSTDGPGLGAARLDVPFSAMTEL